MKISLCMIVKDEEEVLARCLESVADCVDEIILVDTGSTDETVAIAKRFTKKLFYFPWEDNFALARNFSFSKASGDYLLWLDADDVIPDAANEFYALRELLEGQQPDIVMCPYETGGATFYRERILKRTAHFQWVGRVHECIAPRGKIVRGSMRIRHMRSQKERGTRNLDIYRKWAEEEPLGGRDLFYFGRELYYNGEYDEAISMLESMLAGEGWYVNKIEACSVLAACHVAKGDAEKALEALFRSFRYGEPRASLVCEIGKRFQEQQRYREAAFWYESALRCTDHAAEGDFELEGCRTIVPLLELVVCYWLLGEREKAYACHKKTEELSPEHPSVRFNHKFFERNRK